MKFLRPSLTALWFVFLCLCGANSWAQVDMATAEMLMRESGTWHIFDSAGTQARVGVERAMSESGTNLSQSERERLALLTEQAFEPERLRAIAQGVIAKKTRKAHVPALLTWFRSPLGQEFGKLEEAASTDTTTDPTQTMRQGQELLAAMPAQRRAILQRLVKVTRAGEALTSMLINIAAGTQAGLASTMPKGSAPPASQLRKALEQERPQMVQAMNAVSAALYARTYQSVADADIAAYNAFLQSPAGAHFTDVAVRAIEAAFVDAAVSLGRTIPGTKGQART